jgi:ketosteroid isomerase-like protein
VEITSQSKVATQNAKMIQEFYSAFIRGDIQAASKFITNDFIMHVPGKGQNAGEYWGVEGFKQFVSNILAYNGGKFSMEVPQLAVGEDTAFTREIVKFNRKHDPERMFEQRFMMKYSIKNGKISEAWTIPEDLYSYDEYWTPPGKSASPSVQVKKNVDQSEEAPQGISSTKGTYSKQKAQLVQDFYNKFWNGDMEGMKAMLHKDFEFYVPGKSGLADTYKGWEGYLKFRSKLMELAGTKYKLEIESMAASDNEAFVQEYIRMDRKWDSTPQVVPPVILHFVFKDGKVARINDIPVDLYAYETFFTPPAK